MTAPRPTTTHHPRGTAMTTTTTYDLPPRFYDDHVDRDLPAGTEVHRTRRYVRVKLTGNEYDEVLSDARHYSDYATYGEEYFGLVSSARATVKRLLAAGRPPEDGPPLDEPAPPPPLPRSGSLFPQRPGYYPDPAYAARVRRFYE